MVRDVNSMTRAELIAEKEKAIRDMKTLNRLIGEVESQVKIMKEQSNSLMFRIDVLDDLLFSKRTDGEVNV